MIDYKACSGTDFWQGVTHLHTGGAIFLSALVIAIAAIIIFFFSRIL